MPGSGAAPLARCVAFDKYDGTNLHWVWERELGWYGFGTRRDRFDLDDAGIAEFNAAHPGLEQAAPIFLDSLADSLTGVLETHEFYDSPEIIAFTEYLGPNSFAGKHKTDDPKQLVLFDIQIAAGFLAPELFVEHFADLPIARVVYRGKLTGKFTTDDSLAESTFVQTSQLYFRRCRQTAASVYASTLRTITVASCVVAGRSKQAIGLQREANA